MEQSLRSALRDHTRGLHAQLDSALTGPGRRVPDLAGYVRVLATLHALHRHADGPLAAWVRVSPVAEGVDAALVPDRSAAYEHDLRALGVETEPAEAAEPAQSRPVDDARGLALLYLLAGSAAGARVLMRELPETVPAEARRGLTSAAGAASTTLWRQTCALLAQPFDEVLRETVVAESRAVLEMLIGRQELMAS